MAELSQISSNIRVVIEMNDLHPKEKGFEREFYYCSICGSAMSHDYALAEAKNDFEPHCSHSFGSLVLVDPIQFMGNKNESKN